MDIVLVNSKFSHNVLFAEFKLNSFCTNYVIDSIIWEQYNESLDDFAPLLPSEITNYNQEHKYVINVSDGNKQSLLRAKVYIQPINNTVIDCCCGLEQETITNGVTSSTLYFVYKYFVDLTNLQDNLLTHLEFGDDCVLPNSYISNLLRLFTVDIAVKNNDCDIVNKYKKFILNRKTLKTTSNCGCNG